MQPLKGEAKIVFEYEGDEKAKHIAEILDIDNKIAPKELKIKTFSRGKKVITRINEVNIKTLFATVDDLLFSERLIKGVIEI